ncbi:16S rRNA (guanine(966)-N(2))-methyltransferase RsmD [Histidinibacterium lentulum]|uniref:16S rRNA (Guanine(966)-N(2))-methyltransferase RsmD n=1 Tax=Histidinibacterium lentulum TaxID=2480588 RepID=A0A3N2QRA7_9RHOB|nr:16S rRNA (guanine(966)-N(2))-methyltransferase RsmD [Histidinibacterium lentulum]ROT97742.1 16S rRNA (guanine(966)-N(2))-methyltransferase RsmD [Histidinibacterium lentulum]
MRIVGGRHRGLRLAELGRGDMAAALRPTPDRVRESLFNILSNRGLPAGARVLDLFAGTGALGLEALSRGAEHATFVETGRTGLRLIADNLARARRETDALVLPRDATRLGPCDGAPFDLVLMDPPYGRSLAPPALEALRSGRWLAPDALVVVEEAAAFEPPPGFTVTDRRRYGQSHLTFLTPGDLAESGEG